MTIAVTGATGQLGQLVVTMLRERVAATDIVALVRNPDNAASLGVTARYADYAKPETLETALAGVDTLLLISSSEVGQRFAQHRNVIEAAAKVGIKRIVYTSLLHADVSPLSLAEEHRQTEAILKSSGLPYTILRNGWYTENHVMSTSGAIAGGAFIGSAGNGKISGAPRKDYAEAAVAVLVGDSHEGKTYELAADESWTLSDLAAEISKQTGKQIPYKNLSEAEYADVLRSFGVPEMFAVGLASWDVDASNGALFDDGKQLSTLINRPTTPMSAVVAAELKK